MNEHNHDEAIHEVTAERSEHKNADHNHHHHGISIQGKFRFAVIFTALVLVFEIVFGILTNSLALLSDAAHVFTDIFSLVMSWFAIYLSARASTGKRTYGYHRAEILAAFFNGVSLLAIVIWIFNEAIHRFIGAPEVKSLPMLIAASIGLIANLVIVLIFRGESHDNLNVKSAVLHVIGDALSSVGVIVGGIIMLLTEWYVVDAILSCVIGLVILVSAWRVVRDSVHILMEGSPKNVNVEVIAENLLSIEAVKDVHDVHVWVICSHYKSLTAHVLIDEQDVPAMQEILEKINEILRDKFGIRHSTVQLETVGFPEDALLCDTKHAE
ncbi:cation transporter [bacterium]|nr:cation transporter [bacterium]